jgi:hypothetical protein
MSGELRVSSACGSRKWLEKKHTTPFGAVMSDHLICNIRRGWFGGVSQEAIPLRDVTSVTLENRRHPIFGILLALVAVACRAADPIGIVVAAIPTVLAALVLWGSPLIRVNTADGSLRRVGGLPWTRPEAEWFVAAVGRCLRSGTSSSADDPFCDTW